MSYRRRIIYPAHQKELMWKEVSLMCCVHRLNSQLEADICIEPLKAVDLHLILMEDWKINE